MATIDYRFYEEERNRARELQVRLSAEHQLFKEMREKYLAEKERRIEAEKALQSISG